MNMLHLLKYGNYGGGSIKPLFFKIFCPIVLFRNTLALCDEPGQLTKTFMKIWSAVCLKINNLTSYFINLIFLDVLI